VPNYLFFSEEREVDLNEVYGTKKKRFKVRGLIDIFSRYKFTITENTPLEAEIALDPELLGKVFENLLAAYNPETKVTARKQTGSFYTPREVVDYMVDESLLVYLENALVAERPLSEAEGGMGEVSGPVAPGSRLRRPRAHGLRRRGRRPLHARGDGRRLRPEGGGVSAVDRDIPVADWREALDCADLVARLSAAEATIEELRRERDGWELAAAERARDDEAIIEGLQLQHVAAEVTIEDQRIKLRDLRAERDAARRDRDASTTNECEVRDLRGKLAAIVAERDEARASRDVWELRAIARSPTAVDERDAALGAAFSRIIASAMTFTSDPKDPKDRP